MRERRRLFVALAAIAVLVALGAWWNRSHASTPLASATARARPEAPAPPPVAPATTISPQQPSLPSPTASSVSPPVLLHEAHVALEKLLLACWQHHEPTMPAGGPHAPDDTMGALTFRATLVMTSGRMHLEDLTITESTVKSPALDSCLRDTLERSAESLADRGAGDARLAMEDTIRIGDLTALAARPPSPGTAKP